MFYLLKFNNFFSITTRAAVLKHVTKPWDPCTLVEKTIYSIRWYPTDVIICPSSIHWFDYSVAHERLPGYQESFTRHLTKHHVYCHQKKPHPHEDFTVETDDETFIGVGLCRKYPQKILKMFKYYVIKIVPNAAG